MELLDNILEFIHRGGPLIGPLFLLSLALWYLLVKRFFLLQKNNLCHFETKAQKEIHSSSQNVMRHSIDLLQWHHCISLKQHRKTIALLVSVAPLLGLLGTVGGMVSSFASMGGSLNMHESSVAGGISEALLSTQLGLFIAVPGLACAMFLNRREEMLALKIERSASLLFNSSSNKVMT